MAHSNTQSQVFHSIAELVEYGDGPESKDSNGRELGRSSRDIDRAKWHGTDDWPEAMKLALAGWSTKRRTLTEQVSAIVNEAMEGGWGVNGITFDYNEYGTDVDVDRFLEGEPRNMIEWQPTTDRPAIRLVMSAAYSASVRADQVIKRGATVAALVEALGQAGISLEIWMEIATKSHGRYPSLAQSFVRIKSFTEPLDIDAFVYAAAHPSFLRRLVFAAWERLPATFRERHGLTSYGGYGHPVTAEDYSPVGGADIAVPSMKQGYGDPLLHDPLKWIKDTITNLNLQAA